MKSAQVDDTAPDTSRIIAKRTVGHFLCPEVEAGGASCSCVAAQRAVGNRQPASAIVVRAAALASHVAAEGAVSDGQRPAVEDAAAKARDVAGDTAIGNGHRRAILIVDPSPGVAGVTIPNRETGNRDGFT